MSRVIINPRKPERKVFMSTSKKVTIRGMVFDLYGINDSDIMRLLVTSSGLSRSESLLLAEEMDRRKALRESAWGNINA